MRIALIVLVASAAARAQNSVVQPGAPWPTNVDMPRASAMGGAHAAIASSNDALTVNPAGLAQGKRYHFELDGVWDAQWPAQAVMASIVDSSTGPVGSGMLFSRWGSGQPGGRGEGWGLGLGYSSMVGQGLFAGGETKFLHYHGPDGLTAKWAQDVGVLSRRGSFSWAAVVQNISTEKIPLFPPTGTLGVAWGSDADWHLAIDWKSDFSDTGHIKHKVATGFEVLVGDALVLRAGGTRDITANLWWLSAGIGILTERGGLNLVWRRKVTGAYDQFFMAGITLYLE
jgi:hypothetical protein